MSNYIVRDGKYIFHPGYAVKDIIDEYEMTQNEFAQRMNTTPKTLSLLINGICSITLDLAEKLACVTGVSTEAWLNMQRNFDIELAKQERIERIKGQKRYLNYLDYAYFKDADNPIKASNDEEKIANLCRYFRVADLSLLKCPDFLVNYNSDSYPMNECELVCAQAWLQTAINHSQGVKSKDFNVDKLKKALPLIRKFTLKKPAEFIPCIENMLAECGVVFVFLPYLKGSHIHGAVRWFNNKKVMIAMNDKDYTAESFWFALMHEIKHVLQNKLKTVFVSCSGNKGVMLNEKLEYEAEKFAMEFFASSKQFHNWLKQGDYSSSAVKAFASELELHPGIIVGMLERHLGKEIPELHSLKEKYKVEYIG